MNTQENLPNITDYITALSAFVGVLFAGIGLSSWRKQLRGTHEYELAKKLMLQIYQLRNALQATRNPFLSPSEASKENDTDSWEISAYSNRWEIVQKIYADFELSSLEAEVVWDDKTQDLKNDLSKTVQELNVAIYMFARTKRRGVARNDNNDEKYTKTLYYISDEDEFSKQLISIVKRYEKILKPYLKR